MSRVLAVGLDAASMPLIERLIDAGRMPNIERLAARSARWKIDGGRACLRNLQWSQFNFGRRVDGDRNTMFAFDSDTYHCRLHDARHEHRGHPQFWDRTDVKSLVYDIPESAVVDTAISVTAWGSHAPFFPRSSNPPGLLGEIDRTVGVHPALGNDYDAAWHDDHAINAIADALVTGAERRARAFKWLDARHDWELAIVVMSELHSAGHFWWHSIEPEHPLRDAPNSVLARAQLERVYAAVDAAVGDIISIAPPDASVVLFSHDDMRAGHGDVPTVALLPELMHRLHFGAPLLRSENAAEWKAAGCPPVVPKPGWVWRRQIDSLLLQGGPSTADVKGLAVYRWAKRTRLGQRAIARVKGRPLGAVGIAIPAEVTDGVLDHGRRGGEDTNDLLFTVNYQPYWSQMRAFALPSFNPGVVRLNVIGRERDGVVPLDDYEKTCDEIEAAVRACTNPRTGASVVDEVERPRRSDPIDPDGDFADLAFRWTRGTMLDAFEHPELGLIGPVPVHRPGLHDSEGFLFIANDTLDPGDRGERHACDIPATLIALAGAPLGPHLEGRSVLDERSPIASG